jgi:SPP1 gp7 family putative phage head morphogenesis protein
LPASFEHLGIRIEVAIERHVGPLFDKMSGGVTKSNAKQQAVIGVTPKAINLTKFVDEQRRKNIELVKSAHAEYRDQLRALLTDPDNYGMRSETLADAIAERADVSESRAELIARDQTLTLNGQITKERQTAAGVNSYVWSTSLDDRVRPEHAELEGQTFDWDNPPAVGHPGEDILCRCVAIPVVDELDDVFG